VAPNLASNQLILYAQGNDPHQDQTGQFTQAAKLATARAAAASLASQLHASAPLELDVPVSVNVPQPGQPTQNQYGGVLALNGRGFAGLMYVATPQLLAAFGVSPGSVNPQADVLTARAGLASTGNLGLVNGTYLVADRIDPCPAGECIRNPVIQEVNKLPAGQSAPNSVITEKAVKALGETSVPVGWLIQAPSGLTAAQVNAARQAALAAGTTVETKSGQLSLGEISNGATVGGLLLALGVLALTVGLIRSETARDLRTLTATGAGARTRRALTGVTAGVIGLLVVGMPLIGAVVGWLVGGRAPSAVSRQPLE
jgi:putative ABC transport system permease protein